MRKVDWARGLFVLGILCAGSALAKDYWGFLNDEEDQQTYLEAQAEHEAAQQLVESLKRQPVQKQLQKKSPLLPGAEQDVRNAIYRTALHYTEGMPVTTSPILGLRSAWNTSDLLYQISSMNEDLRLLQYQDDFNRLLHALGSSLDTRPLLVFSGGVQSTLGYTNNYTNGTNASMSLSSAEMDVWAILSQWASAFLTINFDDSPPQTGARVANSRLFLQRGFMTIGNLAASPFYLTAGQLFVPFGRYSSAIVTTPLTMSLARIQARALVLGYYQQGFYLEGYGDNGNQVSTDPNRFIFQGGLNLGYKHHSPLFGDFDIGGGYTSNIADSQGMQANGLTPNGVPATQFAGFGNTVNASGLSANNLKHPVGAADFHFSTSRGVTTLITEYISAVRRFDEGDLTYNGEGALVQALQTELDFNLQFHHIPLTVGGAYNRSWEALALNLPQESYIAVASTSLWKNTVQSLEFRHDVNYPVTPNTGGGGSSDPNLILPVPAANVGGSQNLVTLMIGAYF